MATKYTPNFVSQASGGTPLDPGLNNGFSAVQTYTDSALAERVISGTGAPEGAIVGSVGQLFLRTDAPAGRALYVKESGAGTNTGWACVNAFDIASITTTPRTCPLTDVGKLLYVNSASAVTLNIDTAANVGFGVGVSIPIVQAGAGIVTVAGLGGVTVHGRNGLRTAGQWAMIAATKLATDTWLVTGDAQT